MFNKVFEGRIDSLAGGPEATVKIRPRGGGRMARVAQYMVKVIQSDGSDNIRLTLALEHSPDGQFSVAHSTPISAANPGTGIPALLVGDADSTKILGEYLHPILKIKHATTAGAVWARVDVYEMRKPF